MFESYSVVNIEAARRFEYWVDAVCSRCIPAACEQLTIVPFNGALTVSTAGAIEISQMAAPLHRWSRDSAYIRKNPEDDLWIAYMSDGEASVSQNNHRIRLNKGDLVFYDAGRPFEFVLDTHGVYLVRLPRASLTQRCPGVERLAAHRIMADHPTAASMRSMLECAVTVDFNVMHPATAARFGNALLDLVAVMLELQMGTIKPIQESDLYSRVVTYIAHEFEDPDLCLANIAKAHHVSSRTITRAFASHGKTAMGMVWRFRLESSRTALIDGHARSVKEAAFSHGFSDTSHFSRAFRKTFGCAPSTFLIENKI